MGPLSRRCRHLSVALLLVAYLVPLRPAGAVPPDPWYEGEEVDARLFLATGDGNENDTLLRDDSHRFAVGFGASSPVAWNDRLQVNLEIWIAERGYGATTTAAGTPTEGVTFQSAALTYGLRLHGGGNLRPYGMVGVGFQGTRLQAQTAATPDAEIEEETLEPTGHVGLGIEWRVGRDLFSLDWRRVYVKGDFSEFDGRDLDLGGDYLAIGLGRQW